MDVKIDDFVGVFKNAYDDKYCDKVIELFDDSIGRGFGYSRQESEAATVLQKKDIAIDNGICQQEDNMLLQTLHYSIGNEFNKVFWEDCYPLYAEEYPALKDSDSHTIYTNKIQKTSPKGGYHVWHYESGNRAYANRLLTYILYLNDIEDGGETEFLYQSQRVKPEKGTLVIFPAGFTHVHRGNPPLKEDKYIITGWVEF